MIWKVLIRTAVVSLSILLCGSLAEANLCNARSWQTATGPSVQADIQAGQDPTQPCPVIPEGDYPLHLAAVLANDAGAVQALIDAGAGTLTPNGAGETPIALFTARYEQAVLTYGQAGPALSAISRILDLQLGAALLRRRLFRLFIGVFARGRSLFGSFCAGTAPRTAPTRLFRAASPA